jgi:4-hydroxybenzoyl-CoA thioesterase
MLTNSRNVRIQWCDCDPAGIIFYPRYFEIFDTSTTTMIERALGMNKIDYLKAYRFAGHALVEARAQFRRPTTYGDDVVVESMMTGCGRSSFKVHHRISKNGDLAAEGFETRVWLARDANDPSAIRSHPIPPEVVARFTQGAPA